MLAHFARNMSQYFVPVLQLDPKHGVGQGLDHDCLYLDRFFLLRQILSFRSQFTTA